VMAKTAARDVSADEYAAAPTSAEGFRLAVHLLERDADRPTAIFAHNDLMAVGALDAIKRAGLRCPEDISVVGYNDAPLSDHMSPSLTSVRLPSLEVGKVAARVALARIKGDDSLPQIEKLPPTLVPRESSGPVRA
jgi:LacI family transcriptional regulator